jgi:hypothetical protein
MQYQQNRMRFVVATATGFFLPWPPPFSHGLDTTPAIGLSYLYVCTSYTDDCASRKLMLTQPQIVITGIAYLLLIRTV